MTNEVLIAFMGMLGGGSLLAIVNKILNSSKERFDWGMQYRDELRKDIESLEAENKQLKVDLRAADDETDKWRTKYYDLRETKNP